MTRRGRCWVSGKIQYDSAAECLAAYEHLTIQPRVYVCRFCGHYHLTRGGVLDYVDDSLAPPRTFPRRHVAGPENECPDCGGTMVVHSLACPACAWDALKEVA